MLPQLIRNLSSCVQVALDEQHSRRSVLSLAISTVAVTLAAPSVAKADGYGERQSSAEGLKVGIVGAGLAGLTAAYELRRHGADVTIMEATGRIGGRVRTVYKAFNADLSIEYGGEFIDSSHDAIRSLCNSLSIPLLDLSEDNLVNELLSHEYIVNGIRYSEAQVAEAFQSASVAIAKDRELCGDFNTAYARRLDQASLSSYVGNLHLPRWLYTLIISAYEAEYGLPASRQSSLNLIEMMGSSSATGFEIFGDSDERYKIKGGSSRLVAALAEGLAGRVQIHKQLIRLESEGGSAITHFADGTHKVWDKLILAIPFSTLRQVEINLPMSEVKRHCIDQLSYGNNCKLILGLRSRPWRKARSSGYVISDVIQNGWDASQLQSMNEGLGAYTIFQGGQSADLINKGTTEVVSAFRAKAVKLIERIFPGSKNQFLDKQHIALWANYPWSKGSYPSYSIGQRTRFLGIEAEPILNHGVHFAGDHTSNDFQGYMNGAVESGIRAANEVLAAIK